MKYEKYDTVELDNNKTYVVAEIIHYNDNNYLYLANEDASKDYLIVKVNMEDDSDLIVVSSEEEYNKIADLIKEKNQKLLDFLLSGKKE